MRHILFGCLAAAAALAAVLLVLFRGSSGRPVALDVELKVTDPDYKPLSGVPVRIVFGGKNWRAPDTGVRIVTAPDGTARFTTTAVVGRRWILTNIGFTPLRMPVRADHLALAMELAFVLPQKSGEDRVHQWLYTADIDRLPDGDCRSEDLDEVYDLGADGAFTRLIGSNAAGPDFNAVVDGWGLTGAGYKLWNFMLTAPGDAAAGKPWHLQLGLMRKPKPVLVQ